MKYDCELIKEIISFKQNDITIDDIISEHLSECKSCRATYEALVIDRKKNGTSKFALLRRNYKMITFLFSIFIMLSFCLPWFGYVGVSERTGMIILRHPIALIGVTIFILSIWYPFKNTVYRTIVGIVGWSALFLCEILEFLSAGLRDTGIQIGFYNYDIINLHYADLVKSFHYALFGFYLGLILQIIALVFFIMLNFKSRVIENKRKNIKY